MPTASGNIRTTSATKFTAVFLINDLQYTFSGDLSAAVQMFTCNNATLTYGNVGDLTATRQFNGQVGTTSVTLNVTNGPQITGTLDMPIAPASTQSGSGTWHSA